MTSLGPVLLLLVGFTVVLTTGFLVDKGDNQPEDHSASENRRLPPRCRKDMVVGPCKANKRRFYFNRNEKKCVAFFYGGCGGNDNNFMTKAVCESTCDVCRLSEDPGLGYADFKRFHFVPNKGRCVEFTFGGNGGNENNFETQEECNHICVCRLPEDGGSGDASIQRIHFDSRTGRCEKFTFSGQGGNGNNFEYKEICNQNCVCTFRKDGGSGDAIFKKYYFDKQSRSCEIFYYSGFEGNPNKFPDKEACEAACVPSK